MPCYITGSEAGDARLAASEASEEATKAARCACEALAIIEEAGAVEMLSDATQKWWTEHKQIDAERKAREQAEAERQAIRASAVGKLTPEERKALGL